MLCIEFVTQFPSSVNNGKYEQQQHHHISFFSTQLMAMWTTTLQHRSENNAANSIANLQPTYAEYRNPLLFVHSMNMNHYLGDLEYICKNSILHEQVSALTTTVW